MNEKKMKDMKIITWIIFYAAFFVTLLKIGNHIISVGLGTICILIILFVPKKKYGDYCIDKKVVSGKIIKTECIKLEERKHHQINKIDTNTWYNSIVVENDLGDLTSVLTSKVSNIFEKNTYINYDDQQYEVGDRVKLSITKHDDIFWRKDKMFK